MTPHEEDEFHFQASGASAGINSAAFYMCGTCGACVVEMHRSEAARESHTLWHRDHG